MTAAVTFLRDGAETAVQAQGSGSLDAFSNALKAFTGREYVLEVYTEHSMEQNGSGSTAAAYIGIADAAGTLHWGAGTDTDIIHASTSALLSAYNNMDKECQ